jgi:hypothetical protein
MGDVININIPYHNIHSVTSSRTDATRNHIKIRKKKILIPSLNIKLTKVGRGYGMEINVE